MTNRLKVLHTSRHGEGRSAILSVAGELWIHKVARTRAIRLLED